MKTIHLLLLFGALSLVFAGPPDGYSLAWSDEFDGTSLNTDNWQYDVYFWWSGEQQYYTDGLNFECADGVGSLVAKKEVYQGEQYTSCRISSQCKQEFMYGYFELRMKAPMGRGLWPAFWTLGANFPPYNGYCSPAEPAPWPSCGEFEMYETKTGEPGYGGMGGNTFLGTCHYSGPTGGVVYNSGKYTYTEDLGLAFHTYAVLWDETRIQYYFDGEKFWEHDITAEYQTELHQKFFFIANIAIGGNYQGNNIDASIFPQKMSIDYIRVYQKSTQIKAAPNTKLFNYATLSHPQASMKLYDIQGRFIGDYTDRARRMKAGEDIIKTLPLKLPAGIYVVRVFDGAEKMSGTLVRVKY